MQILDFRFQNRLIVGRPAAYSENSKNRLMLISNSHKFIFIHPYHTGGTSIKEALKNYATEPEKFKIRRPVRQLGDKPNPFYKMWYSIVYHAKAKEVKKELHPEVNEELIVDFVGRYESLEEDFKNIIVKGQKK